MDLLMALEDVFKALGDPVRLRIVRMLSETDEMNVCAIIEQLLMTQPAVSHHLAVLKHAGLVQNRKQGQWVHYSLCRTALSDTALVFLQDIMGQEPQQISPAQPSAPIPAIVEPASVTTIAEIEPPHPSKKEAEPPLAVVTTSDAEPEMPAASSTADFVPPVEEEHVSVPAIESPFIAETFRLPFGISEDPDEFRKDLLEAYLKSPCQLLPGPMWKTLAKLENLKCASREEEDGKPSELFAGDEHKMEVYWNKDRSLLGLTEEYLRKLDFMSIHDDYLSFAPVDAFTAWTPSFRLSHDNSSLHEINLDANFEIVDVNIEEEADIVATFIRTCYEGMYVNQDEVMYWTRTPVYHSDLWVWIMDKEKGAPVALGMAGFDASVPEGFLDKIQVLPEYRRKGIGRATVYELLNRLHGRAAFVTASGEADSQSDPAGFLRQCGFQGSDTWWALYR